MKRSPLHDHHVAAGATFAPFAGYEMPVSYEGVLAEHMAVRERVGMFDVSHLGKVRVTGAGAADFVNTCFTNDLARLDAGQAQYTLCCDESGGVIDDLIVYCHSDEHIFCVPNAANAAEVARRLREAAPPHITVHNEHDAYAIIAVQGPKSGDALARIDLPQNHSYMSFVDTQKAHHVPRRTLDVTVCRTGYTGEHGYELVIPAGDAGEVWEALRYADVTPCGLGARDTLRTEMGYPLHGQDLSVDISPLEARLGWAVGWKKPAFWGRDALLAEKEAGPRRLAWGLASDGRAIPRPGMAVYAPGDDAQIGVVTSGTFSPMLQTGVGLSLCDASPSITQGSLVEVQIRQRRVPMRLVRPPFVERSPH